MTPTLLGRWQIRIFLLLTSGLLISLIVALIVRNTVPLYALLYVLLFGLVWDVLYQVITSYRWDRDWPTSFQVAAGIIEGALVWELIQIKWLLGNQMPPPFYVFLIQYGLIWLSIFLLTQGPLRIFWVNWRYQGGQWFVSRNAQAGQYAYQQPPLPAPQGIGGYHFQPPPPPPGVGGGYSLQPPVPFPPAVPTGYSDQRPSHTTPAGPQPAPLYICACGLASDRAAGSFCPRCGRPKVQQGVS